MVLLAVPIFAQVDKDHDFKAAKNMEIFNAIYKNLDLMYVDTLDAEVVVGNGINAMLRSLDPYTTYYPEQKMKELKNLLTGKYAGVGAVIRYNFQLQRVCISEPYENMPAAEVGLKKGDIILSIDDEDMTNKEVSYVSDHLRGDPGSSFMLKVKRPSTGKTMKVKVTRRTIQLPFLPYYGMLEGSIGYINFNSFTEQSAKEVRRAFIDLRKQGAKSLVFDLRNNGGGSVTEAVSIINMFLPKGKTVLEMKGKLQRSNHVYKTTVEPIDSIMPMVVLVNENSASASEIMSGSLQDYDRAVILGTRTYGKGLVQTTMDLPYNGQVKLTTAKYFIPSGRCVQALNYKHDKGGYVEHVPDSLTKVFYTAGGREVRDGGGVKPDVEVKPDSLPNIAFYLAGARDSNEVMLNYEIDYIAKHPTIAPAKEFSLTDADYDEFKARVLKANFQYDRETEKYLKDLEKLAKFEGYYDDAKAEFEALKKKLSHNVAKDLDYNTDAVESFAKGAKERGVKVIIAAAGIKYAGVGAYNNDGTLKAGAKVLYITAKTAKTVSTTVNTGKLETITGLQSIIDAYSKGKDTTPIAFRIIGKVNLSDLDHISSSAEGLQVKGKGAHSVMNMTFEGVGDDATVYGFGFLLRNTKSVEFRNFAIMRCLDDAMSLDTNNSHVWIHNMDLFYGKKGSAADQAKGDGTVDIKGDSKYVTVAYNRFWDNGKASMCGMKSETGENWITYHHNWFDHSDSRMARVRTMSVHMYNNYYQHNDVYGIGATSGSSIFMESNYFDAVKRPIMSSLQGTDAKGDGTFSSEKGGLIKAYGNVFTNKPDNFSYIPYAENNTSFDAYEVSDPSEQVPASVKTLVGGTSYNNFDTDPSLMYAYAADKAEDVPSIVEGFYGAGRLNHGDIDFVIPDETVVTNGHQQPLPALASILDAYTSGVVKVFGESNAAGEGGSTKLVPVKD